MKQIILYDSATGNTEYLAKALSHALPNVPCGPVGSLDCSKAELVYLGFWTDKGTCAPVVKEFLQGLHGKRVALFGTAGFGGSDAYFDQLAARFAAHLPGGCRLTGHFFCQGKMPPSVRRRYEQMQAENPGDPKVEGMLANFDAALAHPSAADLAAAAAFAREQAVR